MTLTEQLYEGTLPTGWYYFNNGVETYIVLYSNANTKDRKLQEPEGITVLGEVPSYEEYIALQSDSLAKNEGAEIVAELKAKMRGYEELWYETNRKICLLSELLVEAKECVEENMEFSKSIGRNRIKPRNKGLLKRIEKTLKG